MKHEEDDLQKSMIEWLRWVLPTYLVFHVPNGGKRGKREGKRLKDQGVLAGIPDICILGKLGRSHWIEVKTPTGRLSKAQRAINGWLAANGVPYVVARSLDDLRAFIAHWRLDSREAA